MGKDYAVTYLDHPSALWLTIDKWNFQVVQYTSNFAINEIPTAVCMLAIGRDARDGVTLATVHTAIAAFTRMDIASVWFTPVGDYDVNGTKWPAKTRIFFGYFAGFALRKVNGKITVIVYLKHWLTDLTCSSLVTSNSHPSNPTAFIAPAVLNQINSAQPANVTFQTAFNSFRTSAPSDLWQALKQVLCFFTNFRATDVSNGACLGIVANDGRGNARARNALARIEGPGGNCSKKYVRGKALPLLTGFIQGFENAIANAVSGQLAESYVHTTMWNKLILEFCPMFNMAVMPLVESALVVADLPAYNGDVWKTIAVGDYDALDQQADMDHPLRAVAATARYPSPTGVAVENTATVPIIGGCFAPSKVDDGVILVVDGPIWLRNLGLNQLRSPSGIASGKPSKTTTTPASTIVNPSPDTLSVTQTSKNLFALYAQAIYVAQMLRGRSGFVSGKLRFDIAPGSQVFVKPTGERFIGAEDQLTTPLYGHVNRVTISINAEAAMAQTTLTLTHIRTQGENSDPRTSIRQHPLFGNNVVAGAPLVEELNL